jgi:hypothetical protein
MTHGDLPAMRSPGALVEFAGHVTAIVPPGTIR